MYGSHSWKIVFICQFLKKNLICQHPMTFSWTRRIEGSYPSIPVNNEWRSLNTKDLTCCIGKTISLLIINSKYSPSPYILKLSHYARTSIKIYRKDLQNHLAKGCFSILNYSKCLLNLYVDFEFWAQLQDHKEKKRIFWVINYKNKPSEL